MRAMNVIIGLAAAALVSASASAAPLIAYEGFDGNSTGFVNTGAAFPAPNGGNTGSAVTAGLPANPVSLSYVGLQTSGGARQGGESAYLKANLASPISSGEVWVSWLYKTPSPAEDWTRLVTYNGTDSFGDSERWNLGNCWGQGLMARSVGGGSDSAYVSAAPDTTYLLVVKYNFGTTGSNTDGSITMYINPTVGGASPDVTGLSATVTDDSKMAFNGIAIAGGTLTQVDELRVGQSFADVTPSVPVPEPASLGLVGLAGMGLLARARRRA